MVIPHGLDGLNLAIEFDLVPGIADDRMEAGYKFRGRVCPKAEGTVVRILCGGFDDGNAFVVKPSAVVEFVKKDAGRGSESRENSIIAGCVHYPRKSILS